MNAAAEPTVEDQDQLTRVENGLRLVTAPFPHFAGLARVVRISLDDHVPTMGVFESYALIGRGPRTPTPLERETADAGMLGGFDKVPEGADVVDCRPPHQYAAWHYPGARLAAPSEVLEQVREMDKEKTYVLYCDVGVQTAPVAEILQRLGYQVYSFRGGTRAIARHERERAGAGASR